MRRLARPRAWVIFFSFLVSFAVVAGWASPPAEAGGFPASFVAGDYPTNHFDDNRTGWNPYETILTTSNVKVASFGPIWQASTDSRTYAQPLVAMAETVLGATHNVVFVATMNDTLYSFDADTGAPLWTRSFQNPPSVTAVPQSFYGNCLTFGPSLGIVATPVYDRLTHSLYVVASTLEGLSGNQHIVHRLHQIAVLNGTDMQTPVVIGGSSTFSDGTILTFNPDVQPDRPGLLESNGNIYVGFGSFDDFYPSLSHGWIFAYNATTFAPVGGFVSERANAGDNYYLGSLWAGGAGIAADNNGNVLFATGNGHTDGVWNYGDSVVLLSPSLSPTPISFFAPSNYATLFSQDLDLGSGGPMLLPPQSTGKHPNLLWIQGKNNISYLLDRDHLTGISTKTNRGFLASVNTHAFFGSPAFYQDAQGVPWVYSNDSPPGTTARLVQYQIVTTPSYKILKHASAPVTFLRFSATPVVSSNGNVPGSAIVWYLDRPLTTGVVPLYAFDASNIANELYTTAAGSWTINGAGALIQPTVTNGKVYVATDGQLMVFGLLGHHAAARKRTSWP